MNKELIIKLAKLANNNPNEHEANSAARRVCKLLAEGNFNFGSTTRPSPSIDIRDDPFWKMWEQVQRRSYEPTQKQKEYHNDFYPPFSKGPKKESEWKDRICSKCGKTVRTKRVFTVEFTCDKCEWTAYHRETRQPTEKEKKKYNTHIHQCKCGERIWYYDVTNMHWICNNCKRQVSIREAAAEDWIMQ